MSDPSVAELPDSLTVLTWRAGGAVAAVFTSREEMRVWLRKRGARAGWFYVRHTAPLNPE